MQSTPLLPCNPADSVEEPANSNANFNNVLGTLNDAQLAAIRISQYEENVDLIDIETSPVSYASFSSPLSQPPPTPVKPSPSNTTVTTSISTSTSLSTPFSTDQTPSPSTEQQAQSFPNVQLYPQLSSISNSFRQRTFIPPFLLSPISTSRNRTNSTFDFSSRHRRPPPTRDVVILALNVIGVLNMVGIMAIEPTPLLFMNENGFTNRWNVRPYVTTRALSLFLPVVGNFFLSKLSERKGTGFSLSLGAIISGGGLLLLLFSRGSLLLWGFAFMMYSTSYALRVVRIALICKIVPVNERTPVLATHALMTPLGAVIGPLVWIIAEKYRGRFVLFHTLIVDRFALAYFFAALVFFTIIVVSVRYLTNISSLMLDPQPNTSTHDEEQQLLESEGDNNVAEDCFQSQPPMSVDYRPTTIQYSNGERSWIDLKEYRKRTVIFFAIVMLGVQMSAEFFMTAFEPVLVNVFHASDVEMGVLIDLTALCAIIPPLAVTCLSRYLKDRELLKIGLGMKLVGMLLYLPMNGSVTKWQVVVGYLLIVKASIFFSTSTMSLFSKVLGPMSSNSLLGALASAQSLGPALAQLIVSDRVVVLFGTMRFGILPIPVIIALVAILWPQNWNWLDPDSEKTTLVREAAKEQHQMEKAPLSAS